MQADAENYLASLQQSIQNELNQSQIQLLDSIDNFMKDYAKKKGYDFVFSKTAGIDHLIYAAPSYDITNEVVKALNKRYAKDKKNAPKKEEEK